jgi:hypothetical protein
MSSKKRMRRRNRTRQGHDCWSCGRHRPNEEFVPRNHTRHVGSEFAHEPRIHYGGDHEPPY